MRVLRPKFRAHIATCPYVCLADPEYSGRPRRIFLGVFQHGWPYLLYMDQVTIIRLTAAVLFFVVLAFLIHRRRTKVS